MSEEIESTVEGGAEVPSLGSRDRNPNFRWFVVHTYSMFEEKAKATLLDRIKLKKMEERFGEIIVPKTSTETVLKSGKKKKVERNAFPGYILVEMLMDEETNHLVRDTPKITGFVGNARSPRPISDEEALRLTNPESIKEQVKAQAANLTFEKGESVKVVDGAFTNFDGVVDAVQSDKMKLRILVSIFGRETPVELEFSQVQKLS